MARQNSLLKIKGSIGDLSFYESIYGDIVRTKGGPSAEKIKKSPRFERVREHNAEFKHCAEAGKSLRLSLHPFLRMAKDPRLVWRVTQLMSNLKNLDSSGGRGERRVEKGLENEEGRKLFLGFDFNSQASLQEVLLSDFKFDFESGKLKIADFVPVRDVRATGGATHVVFMLSWMNPDWKGSVPLYKTEELRVALDEESRELELELPDLEKREGTALTFLQIYFVQEINGKDNFLQTKEGVVVRAV